MEIKRYGLGLGQLRSDGGGSVYGPQIVELDGGEYYKASEVDAILESIGAGGVSDQPITQKAISSKNAKLGLYLEGEKVADVTPMEDDPHSYQVKITSKNGEDQVIHLSKEMFYDLLGEGWIFQAKKNEFWTTVYTLNIKYNPDSDSLSASGNIEHQDALDAIIAQCEKISNRLGFDDYQEAVLEGDLTLAEALRASAWEVSLIGTLAKNLKEEIQQKTIERHHKEFEEFLRSESAPLDPTSKLDQVMIGYAWNVWKAAKGIKE